MKLGLLLLIYFAGIGSTKPSANSEQFRVCMIDDCQGTCAPHCIPPTDPK